MLAPATCNTLIYTMPSTMRIVGKATHAVPGGDQVVPGAHNWRQWGPGCSWDHNWWGPGCSWGSQLVAVGPGCSFLGLTTGEDQVLPGAHPTADHVWDQGFTGLRMCQSAPVMVQDALVGGSGSSLTCRTQQYVHRACAHACLLRETRSHSDSSAVPAVQSKRRSPKVPLEKRRQVAHHSGSQLKPKSCLWEVVAQGVQRDPALASGHPPAGTTANALQARSRRGG
jgi:hypothetical protein